MRLLTYLMLLGATIMLGIKASDTEYGKPDSDDDEVPCEKMVITALYQSSSSFDSLNASSNFNEDYNAAREKLGNKLPDNLCAGEGERNAIYGLFLLNIIGVIDYKTMIKWLKEAPPITQIPRGIAGWEEIKEAFPKCQDYFDHLLPMYMQVYLEAHSPGIMQKLVELKLVPNGTYVTTEIQEDGSYTGSLIVNGNKAGETLSVPSSERDEVRVKLRIWLHKQQILKAHSGQCPSLMVAKPLLFPAALGAITEFSQKDLETILISIRTLPDPDDTYKRVIKAVAPEKSSKKRSEWIHRFLSWKDEDVLRFYHFMMPEKALLDDSISALVELCKLMGPDMKCEPIGTWLRAQRLRGCNYPRGCNHDELKDYSYTMSQLESFVSSYPSENQAVKLNFEEMKSKVDSLHAEVKETNSLNLKVAKEKTLRDQFPYEFNPDWMKAPLIQAFGLEQIESYCVKSEFELESDDLNVTLMVAGLIQWQLDKLPLDAKEPSVELLEAKPLDVQGIYLTVGDKFEGNQLLQLFGDAVIEFAFGSTAEEYNSGFTHTQARLFIKCLRQMLSKTATTATVEVEDVISKKELEELTRLMHIYMAAFSVNSPSFRKGMFIENMNVGDRLFLPAHVFGHTLAFEVIKRDENLYEVTIVNSGIGIEYHDQAPQTDDSKTPRYIYYQKFRATFQQLVDARFLNSDYISGLQIQSHFVRGEKIDVSSMVTKDSVSSQKSGSCTIKAIMYLTKWFFSRPQGQFENLEDADARFDLFKTWLFVVKLDDIVKNKALGKEISFTKYEDLRNGWNMPEACQCKFEASTAVSLKKLLIRHAILRRYGMARKHAQAHPLIAGKIRELLSLPLVRLHVDDDRELAECLKCF